MAQIIHKPTGNVVAQFTNEGWITDIQKVEWCLKSAREFEVEFPKSYMAKIENMIIDGKLTNVEDKKYSYFDCEINKGDKDE